jgi:hypothetical protein
MEEERLKGQSSEMDLAEGVLSVVGKSRPSIKTP